MTFDSSTFLMHSSSAAPAGLTEMTSRRAAPTTDWTDMGPDEHFAQFYESDAFIVDAVSEYIIHGLKSDETCIVAASREHLAGIKKTVEQFGIDLKNAQQNGSYVPLDGRKTLDKFMVDGMPDRKLFQSVIGKVIEVAEARGRRIRIYGEMVGLLCSEGNYTAAVRLEILWNELRRKSSFSLFCGYPMAGLTSEAAGESMSSICGTHGSIIPQESYTTLTCAGERLRRIATLQQRNIQLEAELAELRGRRTSRTPAASF